MSTESRIELQRRYMWTIDDDGSCDIPKHQRRLTMPDGKEVFYPEDMWPPVPGQRCRPHQQPYDGGERLQSGYLGAFYPGGFDTESHQRRKADDIGIDFQPQIRPFADQLAMQGHVALTAAERAHFLERGTIIPA